MTAVFVVWICAALALATGFIIGRAFGEREGRKAVLTELRMLGLAAEFTARFEARNRPAQRVSPDETDAETGSAGR